MKIVVVFDFRGIADVESTDAMNAIEMLSGDIRRAGYDNCWYVDEVLGDTPTQEGE